MRVREREREKEGKVESDVEIGRCDSERETGMLKRR